MMNRKGFVSKLEPLGLLVVLTIVFCIAIPKYIASRNINTPENFPDPSFREEVEKYMNVEPGEPFTREQAAARSKRFVCNATEAESLQGLEYFSKLKEFALFNSSISHFDASVLPEVTHLYASQNENLETVDLSNNPHLRVFEFVENRLTQIDFSQNPKLENVFLGSNDLKTLNVSKNKELFKLICEDNNLKSLRLGYHKYLMFLRCSFNELQQLDVSNCPGLTVLDCSFNQIRRLDVSNNSDLRTLNCAGNKISTINLTQNKILVYADFSNNPLTSINVSQNKEMSILDIRGTEIKQVNMRNNFHLRNVIHDRHVQLIR